MDLSIILPSIRTHNIPQLIESIEKSIHPFTYELIVVGPYFPNIDIKYIYSKAAPTKCVQLGGLYSEGQYITWSSDDGLYLPGELAKCLELAKTIPDKDGIIIRYCEGKNKSGLCPPDHYWIGYTHDDQRLPGIDPNWNIAPVGLYNRNHFINIGGFDCRFEHINMSTHDLAYRTQKMGGKLHLSPNLVFTCDWSQGCLAEEEHVPVHNAHFENDLPLFNQLYGSPNGIIKIDYNNWMNTPNIWRRFQ